MIQARGPLEGPELRRFQDLLVQARLRLRESLARLYRNAVQDNPENLGDTTERTHLADLGSETFEQAQDLGLVEKVSRTIVEIDRALDRMEEGTYGVCENCGKTISIERLEAIPSASRCAACQSKVERGVEST